MLTLRDPLDERTGGFVGDRTLGPTDITMVARVQSSYFCMIECFCYRRCRTTLVLDSSCQS
jgi:hypothetical protein